METKNNKRNLNRWEKRAEHNTKGIRSTVCVPLRYRNESNITTTTKLTPLRYR